MLKTFKNQLITFTVGMILLISLALALLSYRFIYKNMLSVAMSYNNQIVNQLCKNISLFLDGVDESTESLARTSALRFYGGNFITPGLTPDHDEIKAELWKTINAQRSIDDISIVHRGKKKLSLYNMYKEEDLLTLCNYYETSQILIESQIVPYIHFNKNEHPALSCITLTGSGTDPCYIISSVTIDEIFELLENMDLGTGSGTCLIDAQGSIQYSTVTEPTFEKDMNALIAQKDFSFESNFISNLNGQEYIISVYPLANSMLSTVVYIPLSNITDVLSPLLGSILGCILLLLLILSYFSIKISNRLTAPIVTLADHMATFDGHPDSNLPTVKGTKETEILFHTFQEMMERINHLMEVNKQENALKRKAELQALQAQINPHFLYNTLDSINALAILNNEDDISKMTTSLGILLRRSIGNPNEYQPLKEEFDHVKAYIAIQKIRYEDRFYADFHIDSSIASFPVIRLILQPLVENSIYHGLELKESPGHIFISATDFSDHIKIEVTDNGIGVTKENEEIIQQNLAQTKHPGIDCSVGIYNVNERLRLYYGEKAFLTFHSILGEGTTVTLYIPKDKENSNVEDHVS